MWALRWAQARSGLRRAGEIRGVLDGKGDITLNAAEDLEVTIDKTEGWAGIDEEWRAPDSGAISVELSGRPILYGIITGDPRDMINQVTYRARGVLSVLDDRIVLDRHYGVDQLDALKASVWQTRDISWGSICRRMVEAATAKPGGDLPIVYDQPIEDVPAGPSLTLPGWDLGNAGCGDWLRRITDLDGGPDVMFRPRVNGRHIALGMVHGTHNQPGIAQDAPIVLDETARKPLITDLQILTSDVDTVTRAYHAGAGEGAGVALAAADDTSRTTGRWKVYRERLGSSNTDDLDQLAAFARADVATGSTLQATARVELDNPRAQFGRRWFVGDLVKVRVADRERLPAGEYLMRVIAVRFDLASTIGDVTLEPEGVAGNGA